MSGSFIVFEGGEGSGKTFKSKYVVESLKSEGVDVLWTREPGGSPYAEKIREVILADDARSADAETLFGLFWAARRHHLQHTIIPAIEKGLVVISDRFDASTYAYQIVAQEQPQLKKLFWQMREHYVGSYTPQYYVLCDVEPEIGLKRAKSRAEASNHLDDRELAFHERVRQGFYEFLSNPPGMPNAVIDANLPIEEAQKSTLDLVHRLLK